MEDKEKCGGLWAGLLVAALLAGAIGLIVYFMLNQEPQGRMID